MKTKLIYSESRQYVAMCQNLSHTAYHFRQFHLPMDYYNSAYQSEKYARQFIPLMLCCIPLEQFKDCKQAEPALLPEQLAIAMKVGL